MENVLPDQHQRSIKTASLYTGQDKAGHCQTGLMTLYSSASSSSQNGVPVVLSMPSSTTDPSIKKKSALVLSMVVLIIISASIHYTYFHFLYLYEHKKTYTSLNQGVDYQVVSVNDERNNKCSYTENKKTA